MTNDRHKTERIYRGGCITEVVLIGRNGFYTDQIPNRAWERCRPNGKTTAWRLWWHAKNGKTVGRTIMVEDFVIDRSVLGRRRVAQILRKVRRELAALIEQNGGPARDPVTRR